MKIYTLDTKLSCETLGSDISDHTKCNKLHV